MAKSNENNKGIGEIFEQYASSIVKAYVSGIGDLYMDSMIQTQELYKSGIDYANSIFMASMERASTVIENSMGTVVEGFSKTANQIGSEALRKSMAEAKTNLRTRGEEIKAYQSFMITQQQTFNQIAKGVNTTVTSMAEANNQFIGEGLAALGDKAGDLISSKAGNVIWGEVGEAITSAFSAVSELGGKIGAEGSKILGNIIGKQMEYNLKRMEVEQKLWEQAAAEANKAMENAEKVVEQFLNLYDGMRDRVEKSDTESHKFGVQMGFFGRLGDKYAKSMMQVTEQVSEKFGKNTEDLIALQRAYTETSTRNVQMSARNYEDILSTGRAFGLDEGQISNMFGEMNVFNTSIASGTDMMGKMYHTATKMGLSVNKFAKDLQNNLKLAQKYNFKGGLDNLMKMTMWAEQTRVNINSAVQFADKLLSGSISDVLEASAKLQVLGGSSAIYSDPIAMLYEAGADMGSFMRRQAALFNDIKGTFNEKTGETEFSWYENMMIKQRAKAAGMDEGDVKDMIRQRGKQTRVDAVLKGSGLSDEDMTAIGNRATYNQKKQRWEVTDITGKTHDIKEIATNRAILDNLLPENNDEALLQVAQKSLGFAEKQTIYQAWLVNHFGAKNYEDVINVSNRMLAQEKDHYAKMDEVLSGNMKYVANAGADAMQYRYGQIEASQNEYTSITRDYVDRVNDFANQPFGDVKNLAKTFADRRGIAGTTAFIESFKKELEGVVPEIKVEDIIQASLNTYENSASTAINEVLPQVVDVGKELVTTMSRFSVMLSNSAGELHRAIGTLAFSQNLTYLPYYFGDVMQNGAGFAWNSITSSFKNMWTEYIRGGHKWEGSFGSPGFTYGQPYLPPQGMPEFGYWTHGGYMMPIRNGSNPWGDYVPTYVAGPSTPISQRPTPLQPPTRSSAGSSAGSSASRPSGGNWREIFRNNTGGQNTDNQIFTAPGNQHVGQNAETPTQTWPYGAIAYVGEQSNAEANVGNETNATPIPTNPYPVEVAGGGIENSLHQTLQNFSNLAANTSKNFNVDMNIPITLGDTGSMTPDDAVLFITDSIKKNPSLRIELSKMMRSSGQEFSIVGRSTEQIV